MRRIWKYPLFELYPGRLDREERRLRMPDGRVVSVGAQGSMLCVWVDVTDEMEMIERLFIIHGTGRPVDMDEQFIGTVFDEPFVWHVFEGIP